MTAPQKHERGEHRTTGGRAWCYDCSEWCYTAPEMQCKCCRVVALEAEVAALHVKAEYDALLAEVAALREVLQEIRDNEGKVCEEYEICTHPACRSSYESWRRAAEALDYDAAQKAQP